MKGDEVGGVEGIGEVAMRGVMTNSVGLLVARFLLAAIFIHEGLAKLGGFAAAAAYTRAFGVPEQLLPLAIALEFGCGLLLVLGFYTRPAAVGLFGFCLITALVFHSNIADRNQLLHFEKNLAIAGGFLALAFAGAGRFSLDRWLRGR